MQKIFKLFARIDEDILLVIVFLNFWYLRCEKCPVFFNAEKMQQNNPAQIVLRNLIEACYFIQLMRCKLNHVAVYIGVGEGFKKIFFSFLKIKVSKVQSEHSELCPDTCNLVFFSAHLCGAIIWFKNQGSKIRPAVKKWFLDPPRI